MAIHEEIYKGRKRLKMTQEQMAEYLGVTAPAVHKWESGASCPDVGLLPAIARLLETDLNTLLCFEETLTEQEILRTLQEVQETIEKEGMADAFSLAKKKMQEFPSCTKLLHKLALMLDGNLVMSGLSPEEKKPFEEELLGLYERLAKSPKAQSAERDGALFMLCSKYMGREEYEKAEELLELLPEPSELDKRQIRAHLQMKKGETAPAAEFFEQRLMMRLNEIQGILFSLMELEAQEKNEEQMEYLAEKSQKLSDAFEMGAYYPSAARMQNALYREDEEESLFYIEKVLEESESMKHAWECGLYPHMEKKLFPEGKKTGEEKKEAEKAFSMRPGLLSALKSDPKCEFLRENPKYQQLMKKYGV